MTTQQEEKSDSLATHLENANISPVPSNEDEVIHFDPRTEKKLMRKVDRRLLPILGALYSIALIDRVNVSASSEILPLYCFI